MYAKKVCEKTWQNLRKSYQGNKQNSKQKRRNDHDRKYAREVAQHQENRNEGTAQEGCKISGKETEKCWGGRTASKYSRKYPREVVFNNAEIKGETQ